MRRLLSGLLIGALVLCGCAHRRVAEQQKAPPARAGASGSYESLIVTLESALVGKVATVNTAGRFVVLNFRLGKMAAVGQSLNMNRRGLKVGEVKITGPQREENIVADLVTGDAEVGDEAGSQHQSMTWPAFNRMLERFQVPRPCIVEMNGQRMPCQRELSLCQRLLVFRRPGASLPAYARAS